MEARINASPPVPASVRRAGPLWQQAVKLEAVLFAQMLDSAGVGGLSPPGGGSGAGGGQFDSFLRQAQAEAVAGSGATGIAEAIYRDISARRGGAPP
ncbi:rod-binding protein [Jannaschia sp. W003]|uniref:rod-binding protein n=1 Tax=Jannaschia sp. W003 TaxID=2867012 RepID=UPI0021A6AE58|nr:rod-binding protein [Jannaschia sp. W003]UWQ21456.1 flagellar biosynthesis protein FlgJ [Jannaschia sp. W003]